MCCKSDSRCCIQHANDFALGRETMPRVEVIGIVPAQACVQLASFKIRAP